MHALTPSSLLISRRGILPLLGRIALGLALLLAVADAYELEGIRWPDNQTIALDLQLGNPQGTLIDGSTSWDQVIAAAADIWNPSLGSGVRFQTRETNYAPAQGDGKNTVFFSGTVFGEGFGDDTLATTAYLYTPGTKVAVEADIVFNVAQSFNSYRGPLRGNGGAPVYDVRRIALHELGHVLGLAHVAPPTPAIMQPDISNLDTIQADDIAGVEAIYGNPAPVMAPPVITGNLTITAAVGQLFVYQITATNHPTSYSVSDYPPGVGLNSVLGAVVGKPTAAGTYDVTIGATNAGGTGTAVLHFVFTTTITITSDAKSTAYVGRPFYYQVATTGQPTGFRNPGGLLHNVYFGVLLDPFTGLLSGTPTEAGDFDFTVEADAAAGSDRQLFDLVVAYDATLSTVCGATGVTALFAGGDGNLYGALIRGGNGFDGSVFRLGPDGTLATVCQFTSPGLVNPTDLHRAADGSFYGAAGSGGDNDTGGVFKIAADGTLTTLASLPALPSGTGTTPTVLLAADGNYYLSVRPSIYAAANPGGWIYKLTPDGTLTNLHTFNGNDGFCPSALIQAADGNFYGVTYQGGTSDLGTVFEITPDGVLTTLHSFTSAEGTLPLAPLLQASDGNFYGTTGAGAAGQGTVFEMTPDGAITTLHAFAAAGEGSGQATPLVRDGDGNFYGSTSGPFLTTVGRGPNPILFKLAPDGTLTVLHTFATNEGCPALLPLVPDGAGNFFGVAAPKDVNSVGTVFKETPSAVPLVYAPPPVITPTVTLTAAIPQVTAGGGGVAEFNLSLSALQDTDVTVNFTIKGTAVNGTDYAPLKTTKKIKAGKLSKPVKIVPQGDLGGAGRKTVVLSLQPGDGYTVGTTDKVKVKIVAP